VANSAVCSDVWWVRSSLLGITTGHPLSSGAALPGLGHRVIAAEQLRPAYGAGQPSVGPPAIMEASAQARLEHQKNLLDFNSATSWRYPTPAHAGAEHLNPKVVADEHKVSAAETCGILLPNPARLHDFVKAGIRTARFCSPLLMKDPSPFDCVWNELSVSKLSMVEEPFRNWIGIRGRRISAHPLPVLKSDLYTAILQLRSTSCISFEHQRVERHDGIGVLNYSDTEVWHGRRNHPWYRHNMKTSAGH
jgi:hypothetical protein